MSSAIPPRTSTDANPHGAHLDSTRTQVPLFSLGDTRAAVRPLSRGRRWRRVPGWERCERACDRARPSWCSSWPRTKEMRGCWDRRWSILRAGRPTA